MENGYIKLHRKILDNPISTNIELLGFISYILLRANHKPNDIYIGNTKVHIEPGQFVGSILGMSQQFGKSLGKIQRMLKILEDEGIAISKGYSKYSLFTVINRQSYQSNDKQTENKGDTNKNDKNDNNIYPPDFSEFWSTFPHGRKGKKKDSYNEYKKHKPDQVMIATKLLSYEVDIGIVDVKYISACERWIRDFTYNDISNKARLIKICERMIEDGLPPEKKKQFGDSFPEYNIRGMFQEVRERKKDLLHKSIVNAK